MPKNILADNYINKSFQLKDLSDLGLEEILQYYNDDDIMIKDNLSDIYYYKYDYNLTHGKKYKYSKNFLKKYKDKSDIRIIKKNFKKEYLIII